jgi:exonuclease III
MYNKHWKQTGQLELRAGIWNVRNLFGNVGALQTLTKVVEKYNVKVIVLQETRWPGVGSVTSGSMVFMYGGNENNKHENGVGFLIHKSIMPQIKQFIVVNKRICYIRINMKHHDWIIICTYAPTETADEEIKNSYYDSLENTYNSLPNHCVKIIMEDLNIQIEQEEVYKTCCRET